MVKGFLFMKLIKLVVVGIGFLFGGSLLAYSTSEIYSVINKEVIANINDMLEAEIIILKEIRNIKAMPCGSFNNFFPFRELFSLAQKNNTALASPDEWRMDPSDWKRFIKGTNGDNQATKQQIKQALDLNTSWKEWFFATSSDQEKRELLTVLLRHREAYIEKIKECIKKECIENI
jgi:hypothetical protein